eukprot:gene7020-7806_t
MSSKGATDVRREKMREEAKKERAKRAKAANILYRNEYNKIGDVGFVSRKVAPNTEDPLSCTLKTGLIDYRELLRRKDYYYLGIDNDVPGTPEVHTVNFEEAFKRMQPNESLSRVNGFKGEIRRHLDEDSASKGHSQQDNKPKPEAQQKTKPPFLTMPTKSCTPPIANNKTPSSDPCKIESILKEMIDTAPPLTDIRTPVKTQDSRFPFPQFPPVKESNTVTATSGSQGCPVKSEEMLKNDLITTSDDESEDEARHAFSSATIDCGSTRKVLLSASSSSSSSESSSDSSDSDSSDSENETKHRKKAAKSLMRPPGDYANAQQQPTTTTTTVLNQQMHVTKQDVGKRLAGKVIRNEICETQASPLNSAAAKDAKKDIPEALIITENNTKETEKKTDRESLGLKHNDHNLNMHNQPFSSSEYIQMEPLFKELFDPQHGISDAAHDNLDIADMMSLDPMPPPFDDSLDITVPSSVGFSNDNADHMEDSFDPVTVDMSVLSDWNSQLDNDDDYLEKTVPKKKKSDKKNGNEKPVKNNTSKTMTSNRKNLSSSQNRLAQSKKNSESDWFKNILSPKKKYVDLPYVDPDKLKIVGSKESVNRQSTPCKSSLSLEIKIPLNKIKDKSNAGKSKQEEKVTNVKKSNNSKTNEVKKVKKKRCENKTATGRAVGKDIETIKKLMAETSKAPSDGDEVIDVVGTLSPIKKPIIQQQQQQQQQQQLQQQQQQQKQRKHDGKYSGKVIRNTPESSSLKKDFTSILNNDNNKSKDGNRTSSFDAKHESARKRTHACDGGRSDRSYDENVNMMRVNASKLLKLENYEDDRNTNVQDMDLECDGSDSECEKSLISHHDGHTDTWSAVENRKTLHVSIDLQRLKRHPKKCHVSKDDRMQDTKGLVKQEDGVEDHDDDDEDGDDERDDEEFAKNQIKEEHTSSSKPTWKPPPNIKIPKLTKRMTKVASKQIKNCSEPEQENSEQDSSLPTASFKQNKDVKEKKTKRPIEGRGVKWKDCNRPIKSNMHQNPNVCGMCGSLQKDTGRDPIRLGTYKTSYVEYLSMGKRNKRIADCLDPSERAPQYIDAVLKYIHYLVGLEITGKINTKKGIEEYMCITSQCIDLVDLRLQSVLYFKLFGIKKDSASRYAKLLSDFFKVRRSPHRVSIKGSTGTPSPMSPTSSQNGSVASFGSAGSTASSGSYDKLSSGNMVSIPAEMFERMQQYFTYTKYLLHGQRLWDDSESLSVNCQEFIGVVSRRIGALTMQRRTDEEQMKKGGGGSQSSP